MLQEFTPTLTPTAPVLTEAAFDGTLTVVERDGTTHIMHPYPTVEGVNKMTWVAATGERIDAKLTELQAIDVLEMTDEVIEQIGRLYRQSAQLSEHLMQALVPDYPQGLFSRLHIGVAMQMQARAMQVAMTTDDASANGHISATEGTSDAHNVIELPVRQSKQRGRGKRNG